MKVKKVKVENNILDGEFKNTIIKAVEQQNIENNEEFVFLNSDNFALLGKKNNETVTIERLIPKVL